MANQIKSHPDGNIYITNGIKKYVESSANFAADMQTLNKSNPQSERTGAWQYDVVSSNDGNFSTITDTGEHNAKIADRWINAERAISAIDELLALQAERLAAQSQPQL